MDAEVISSELRDYEALRERLIDVSGRNRLLNFKSEGTSVGAGIRLIDSSFEAVFDHLMSEKPLMFASLPAADSEPPDEKAAQFQILLRREKQSDPKYLSEIADLAADDTEERQKAERDLRDRLRAAQGMLPRPTGRNPDLPGWAQVFGISPAFELPLRTETRATSTARTLMLPETMEKRLLRLERNVRAVELETGVSTLHLALGFLEWFESDSAGDPLISPLLLLPVALTHEKLANGSLRFHFSATDSDPQINLSLQFRLAADFRLELPKFDAEVNNPVATYIDSIHGLIRGRRRWKIRNYLTLAPFSFTRIAMYRDLDPVHWPANGGPAAHPLVRPILRGISDAPTDPDAVRVRHAGLHNIDDPAVVQAAPILVHDADSSQHSALIDAMNGKNLAIQGPPGTGKSQTIANLIANALYRGKSILFVSEKMAALEVVKDRLDKVGLGEFCLTLHAAGSKLAAVMEALKRRDSLPAPRQVPRDRLPDRMATTQATIARHLDTMHGELKHDGDTLHSLIGRIASLDSANPSLPRLMHSFISRVPAQIELATVYDAERSLAELESSTKVSGKDWQPSLSPFYALDRGDLSVLEQEELFERMGAIVVVLESAVIGLQSFHRLIGTDPAMRIGDMSDMLQKIERLEADAAAPDRVLLSRMTSRQAIKKVQAIANRIQALISARDHLASFPKLQHDSAGLRALMVAAQDMAVLGNTVGEIRALAGTAIARAATIKESREGIDAVVNFFRFDDATSLAVIRMGCVSLDRLHKIDPLAIQYRRHGLENHVTALNEAAKRQGDLIQERTTLAKRFDLIGLEASSCRAAAETLRNAGAFGFLQSSTRRAATLFNEHWRGGPVPPRSERAELLDQIASMLDAETLLNTNAELKSILGLDADIGTYPLSLVAQAAAWQRDMIESLAAQKGGAHIMTELVLAPSMDVERLRLVVPLALRCIAAVAGENVSDMAWSAAVQEKSSEADTLARMVAQIDALGLPEDLPMTELEGIARGVETVAAESAELRSPRVKALVNPEMPLDKIRATVGYATSIHDLAGESAPRLLEAGWENVQPELERQRQLMSPILHHVAEEADRIAALGFDRLVAPLESHTFGEMRKAIAACLVNRNELPLMVDFVSARAKCIKNPLAEIIVRGFEASDTALRGLVDALHWAIAMAQVQACSKSNPDVFGMSGQRLSALRADYAEADRNCRGRDAGLVIHEMHKLGQRTPAGNSYGPKKTWTERALLDNEFSKQKRLVQVRDLLARAPQTIKALTPCLMMSPLTVAQYLQPGRVSFDLVIMDEASQVRPEDAIGALLRGKQVIIVGDEKQLPPTSFFERKTADDDEDDEDDAGVDGESVLALAARAFAPQRLLMWHYRSQHDSLINFSNREFYDSKLVVFPARAALSATLGIELVRVRGVWHEQVNDEEAEAVVQAIRYFTANYPELSLGVVTMNSKQRDLIEQKIDDLEDDLLVKYKTDWDKKHESFFVKNLENVQGDERDVIFISFGWGRTKEGAFHQRFNLVNRADGHRRLNVLFTRAKRKIVIFTGLEPKNIIYEEGRSARGVRVLREYLEYAGSIDSRTRADNDNGLGPADFDPGDPDSPFEQSVGEALRASGYRFRYQVGAAGYRIDIGILYPGSDNSYAVGIECDGATYHRAASTRDRDRLRQEALERLGWKILRIWSTDWFRDWRGQINRLKIEIDAALVMLADSAPSRLVTTDFATEMPSPNSMTEMESSVTGDQEAIPPTAPDDEIAMDKPPSPGGANISIADRLRHFRETTIMVDFPGSEPQRCILREEMISQFVAKLLVDPADFTARIPEHLRIRTDGRQMRYLEKICEIISQPRE